MGRFVTVDGTSIREHVERWQENFGLRVQPPLEINSFARVANSPLRWVDPTGLYGELWDDPNEEPPYVAPLPEFDHACWTTCVLAKMTSSPFVDEAIKDGAQIGAQNRKRGLAGQFGRWIGKHGGRAYRALGPIGYGIGTAIATNLCAHACAKTGCQNPEPIPQVPDGMP